ncbi:MAG TPA: MCP four helix bundle domain-containing protein [Candidatus Brocadiales bacterium]|nr:MCP four helix bundle domain-containing protein [Candidatus Brocadiales bacterium]
MNRIIYKSLVILSLLGLIGITRGVLAGELDDLKAKLGDVRGALVAMLDEKDKAKQEELHAKIKKLTKDIDELLPALIAKEKGTEAKGKLVELKETWEAFRNTRDTQIIPAIYGGKVEEAKAIAGGVQKERFKKMSSIVDDLIGKK